MKVGKIGNIKSESNSMKKKIMIGLALIAIGGSVVYAMGMRCSFCQGTGFQPGTNFQCSMCKGTGHDSNY